MSTSRIRFGLFELDTRARRLYRQGRVVRIQDQPLAVLELLLEKRGQVVTREELQQRLWRGDVHVDFELGLTGAIKRLRQALDDSANNPRFVATAPKSGYRFIAPVEFSAPPELATRTSPAPPSIPVRGGRHNWKLAALVIFAGLLAGRVYWVKHLRPKLNNKDMIVLADFTNTTKDPVFDDSLQRALAVSLQQSPFLNLLSDEQVQQTLRRMGKAVGSGLGRDIASEVCQRNSAKAYLAGSISALGNQYLITVDATNCTSGASLVETAANAAGKDKVLKALGEAASQMREKLGESLTSVQKYDAPLENVTTSSLEALKSYSLGMKTVAERGSIAALPYFKHAIELDPNFAAAYAHASAMYANIGETVLATEYAQRAYDLRNRVTERERFYLELLESSFVTGDLVNDEQTAELFKKTYPREAAAYAGAASDKMARGDYLGSLQDSQIPLSWNGTDSVSVGNLWQAYAALNRFQDAKVVLDKGVADGIDPVAVADLYYLLAFVNKDAIGMQRQIASAVGKPEYEDGLLAVQASTEACYGRVNLSKEYTRRAVDFARQRGSLEAAAARTVTSAWMEAEFGKSAEARQDADAAIRLLPAGRYTRGVALLVFARTGDIKQARILSDALGKEFPQDTIINRLLFPLTKAALELNRHNPGQAVKELSTAAPYELGMPSPIIPFLAVLYLRGKAFLDAGQAKEAEAEFERIREHPGIALNSPIMLLAQLGLARALAAAGEKEKSLATYQDFLALWKDADPELPILKQAQAEYAKLR